MKIEKEGNKVVISVDSSKKDIQTLRYESNTKTVKDILTDLYLLELTRALIDAGITSNEKWETFFNETESFLDEGNQKYLKAFPDDIEGSARMDRVAKESLDKYRKVLNLPIPERKSKK